ncbi:hypothetical protein [Kitasatospora phosalacinea]|uniref:Uncharacterized protein n=1 Tax=Kitasatospora phosalacinea TaxID=2065 RepID=A0A9W6UQ66_9ACTN|nr:hypothetical protein [Kitasatospora phosalacinea]GLW56789.1 hypothetical protein Kpho01_48000 [Kitasatospora phosalacinea]
MLVHLLRLRPADPGPPLAEVRTPHGPAVALWRGDPADPPGPYHVEWTVDEDHATVRPAPGPAPAVRTEGGLLLLTGEFDGAGVLRTGDSLIPLDLPAPPGRVEVAVPCAHAELYPYTV